MVHDKNIPVTNFLAKSILPFTTLNLNLKKMANSTRYVALSKHEQIRLPTKDMPCNDDPLYSIRDCWERSLQEKAKCVPPWEQLKERFVPFCNTTEELSQFIKVTSIDSAGLSGRKWSKYFNCPPSCSIVRYIESDNTKSFTSSDVKMDYGGYALIHLAYENDEVTRVEDIVNYDFNNFVGEAGGSLGFFMGASAITFYELISRSFKWFSAI